MARWLYRSIWICALFICSSMSSRTLQYSVNLMWINKAYDAQQPYIYPAQSEDELYTDFLQYILAWAEKTEHGIVQLWFDSEVTPDHAIENTRERIYAYAQSEQQASRIRVRDIRALSSMQHYLDRMSDIDKACMAHPKFERRTPVYFRTDLFRVIAACHELMYSHIPYFIYADIDMEPVSQEELFDAETCNKLHTYGFVLAHSSHLNFENGFFIMARHDNVIHAHIWAIIQVNIERAHMASMDKLLNGCRACGLRGLEQSVYGTYPAMLQYFYFIEGYGDLYTLYTQEKELYDKEKHGLRPFGIQDKHSDLVLQNTQNLPGFPQKMLTFNTPAPTKTVNLPRASLNYNV